jgi:hypothetical protein
MSTTHPLKKPDRSLLGKGSTSHVQHGSHVVAHIRGQRHQDNRDRQERVRLLGKVTTPGNRFQRGEVADCAPPVGSFVRFAVQTRNKHT